MPIQMRHHYTARHIAIHRYAWLLLSRRGTITRCGYVPWQAASNAALVGGSSSTKQGHPIAKVPAMRYNGILVRAQTNAVSL